MTQHTLFQREVLINAPLHHVWQFVATEEGLRQWWGNLIQLEPKQGGRCEEWRTDQHGTSHWQGVVTLYAPPHQLVMTLRPLSPRTAAPELTTIAITLEAQDNTTRVHIAQRAFGPTPAIGKEPAGTAPPHHTPNMPLAQLDRAAPGAIPMPSVTPQVGEIDPTHWRLTREEADALQATWAARLTALSAYVAR